MATIEYTGAGAVRTSYGPLESPTSKPFAVGARESTRGNVKEIEYNFTFDNLPAWTAANALDALVPVLPAYAVIIDAVLLVTEPFAGGTALEVGTFQAVAGTVVDADGIIPAAVGVVANLNAAGEGVYGTGIQVLNSLYNTGGVAATGIIAVANTTGATTTVIGVVATGTFTAGRGRLVVSYLDRNG